MCVSYLTLAASACASLLLVFACACSFFNGVGILGRTSRNLSKQPWKPEPGEHGAWSMGPGAWGAWGLGPGA